MRGEGSWMSDDCGVGEFDSKGILDMYTRHEILKGFMDDWNSIEGWLNIASANIRASVFPFGPSFLMWKLDTYIRPLQVTAEIVCCKVAEVYSFRLSTLRHPVNVCHIC